MFDNSFFDGVERYQQKRRDEFHKLACEPCVTPANVGDRVLISAGPAGRGFEWERHEAIVLEVADTAYRLHILRETYDKKPDIAWIHKFIVTDVLGPAQEANQ